MMPSRRKTAWQEAAWIFGMSRFALLIITVMALRFPLAGMTAPRTCAGGIGDCFLSTWYHWDVLAYTGIAAQGYSNLHDTVFLPLWPLLLRGLGFLFGGSTISYYVAGLLLANALFYFALVVFYQLVSEDFDPAVARNALFYLSFAPYALFFFAGYTESLFLLLCLLVFFCLRSERWWLAGVCGFLAALSRSQGVLLAVPFLVVLLQRFFWKNTSEPGTGWLLKLRACAPLVLIPLGVVMFAAYLAVTKGAANTFAFSTQEAEFWQRHLAFPFVGIVIATIQTFWQPSYLLDLHLLNALDLAALLISVAILALGWQRLPLHYNLFALALILFDTAFPQGVKEPLNSFPRFAVVIFPIFVVTSMWGKDNHIDRMITVGSISLFAINTALFISHYWVA